MSGRSTRNPRSQQSKDVAIPDGVPVGAVIGKGGSNCKMLRKTYRVGCFVDTKDRKVKLCGTRPGMNDAEEALAELFERVALTPARVFEVGARDGPSRLWAFEEELIASSDPEVEAFPYVLQPRGVANPTRSHRGSWIQEFRTTKTGDMMSYLADDASETSTKVKVAFGHLHFMLKKSGCENIALLWPELQKLEPFQDVNSRWSNICARASPARTYLLEDLEERVGQESPKKSVLSVHLRSELSHKSWDLNYRLVDGAWKLGHLHTRRTVHGTYDVILDGDTSFRVRAEVAGDSWDDVERHLDVRIPANGDFFETEVLLKSSAPSGFVLKSTEVKSKLYVNLHGLRFMLGYLDQQRSDFRLECRLATTERDKLNPEDKECELLVNKVLELLE